MGWFQKKLKELEHWYRVAVAIELILLPHGFVHRPTVEGCQASGRRKTGTFSIV